MFDRSKKVADSPHGVVGSIFKKCIQKYIVDSLNKGGSMRSRMISFLIVTVVAIPGTAPSAAQATNGHQDHRGACARSTTSISKGVSDLAFNGVLTQFGSSFGINSFDGSLQLQMKNRLTVGVVVKSTVTNNNGCDGHGHTFGVGHRTLFKGEKVVVKTPAKFGKDVCVHSHKGCKAVTFTVPVVLPASCWNLNTGRVTVKIWVKVKKHKAKPKPKPCQCQPPAACNCTPPSVTVICGNATTNNSGSVEQGGNCNNTTVVCSYNGNNGTQNTTNTCSPPPPPPPPSSSAACTGLNVVTDEQVARGVIATVTYQATNTSLVNVHFDWGDNTFSDTGTTLTAKHVYQVANTYTVNATLTFQDSSGNTSSATCSAQTVTPKDGTSGAGTGSGDTGGSGAGGTGSSGTGDTCIDPITGEPRPMQPGETKDQLGYCR